MTYSETVEWMYQQLPMYQQIGDRAFKKDLSNIQKLAARLQEPHKQFKSIHVAGTNGKGSVSHMLASVLQESGYKVGLYTSPHLKDFRERIRINGKEIEEQAVINFIEKNREFFEEEQLSFFEMTVGMAFNYFAEEEVDIAVIEVGLGGRLDSTNIILPELSIITNIGFDHVQFLGESLAEIASEKAGIIKNNVPVLIGETQTETTRVFKKIASEANSDIYFAEEMDLDTEEIKSDLKGKYQQKNIKTVFAAIALLKKSGWKIQSEAKKSGLKHVFQNTGLRGRWEILQNFPKIICDTAHNKEGLLFVMAQLKEEKFDRLHIVFGVVKDKDLTGILPLLPKDANYYFCRPNIPRGLDAETLTAKANELGLGGKSYSSVEAAFTSAKANAKNIDVIFVGGSTFTVAEVI